MQTKVTTILMAMLLLFMPFTVGVGGLPDPEDTLPDPLDDTRNGDNIIINATPGAIISPRVGMSSHGYDKDFWGDFTKDSITNGAYTKKIGNDGEIYLEYNNNGTIHKITISLMNFKGSSKVTKAPKEINTTQTYISKEPVYNEITGNISYYKSVVKYKTQKIPSEANIPGNIGSVPVTILWQEYSLQTKETVTWNSTSLKNVVYEIKIQSNNFTLSYDTLDILFNGKPIGMGLERPILTGDNDLDIDLSWDLTLKKGKDKDKTYWLNINWTYPIGSQAPYVLDPTISFDGTTFTIDDAQWEIKTYQQVWSILGSNGENPRFLGGYTAADSDGSGYHIDINKALDTPIDTSEMSDFSFNLKTTNGDASWQLQVYMNSAGGWASADRHKYSKVLTNDVDATYILSDFVKSTAGTVDDSAIDYIAIACENIDTGEAANVIIQVKDLKFTSPVKTSNFYDSTGRFVLGSEDFEGDDGLNLSSYDTDWTVTTDGTSVAEIDDAQKAGGSTSALLHGDGTNVPIVERTTSQTADYTRFAYHARVDGANVHLEINLQDDPAYLCTIRMADGGTFFRIYYGNGVGGDNVVDSTLVIDTWYEIWIDVDLTNDKYRVWINGIMYPGPNANAQGFDNFMSDTVGAEIDNFKMWMRTTGDGVKNAWVDDIQIYAGFEDFSALTSPHDIDEISEAVSPSGTDYGRGTQDGDWNTNGVGIGVDNTKVVIGTNSIKGNDLDYGQSIGYTFDSSADLSGSTHCRFYVFPETGIDRIRLSIYSGSDYRYLTIAVTANKWNYINQQISVMTDAGLDQSAVTIVFVMNGEIATSNLDLWIDGFHFYGDPAAGTCWQGNSLDPNGAHYKQDRAMYNIFDVDDNSGSPDEWSAVMSSATDNLTVEWSDVANAGIANGRFDGQITLTGFDVDNHIKWTSVGDTTPTNDWTLNTIPTSATAVDFTNVTFEQYYRLIANKASGNMALIDFVSTLSGVTNSGIGAAIHPSATLINLNITTAANSYAAFVPPTQYATPFKILDSTFDASAGGVVFRFWGGADDWNIYCRNCDFDKTDIFYGVGAQLFISKNHNKGSEYVIATGTIGMAYSDIIDAYQWDDGADVEILSGTFNIDENATLTNGSWTKDATATVNIQNDFKLNMINSTFTALDFTIEATGSLVESNFTTASFVVSGSVASGTVTNTTYSSWVGHYNSWNGSGYQPVTWLYEWGDGINTSSTTEMNQEHDYGTVGSFIVTIHTFLWNDDNGNGEFPIGVFIIANFTFYNTGGFYSFVDTSATNNTTIISWAWDFGDGSTSTEQSPDHQYTIKGEYTVTLTVIDNETNTNMTSMDIGVTWFTPSEQITYVITPFVEAAIILLITLMVIFKLVLMPMQKSLRRMV